MKDILGLIEMALLAEFLMNIIDRICTFVKL